MVVRKGQDAALDCVHVPVHTHMLVSPNTEYDAFPASSKQPRPTGCLYICLHKYVIRLLQAS